VISTDSTFPPFQRRCCHPESESWRVQNRALAFAQRLKASGSLLPNIAATFFLLLDLGIFFSLYHIFFTKNISNQRHQGVLCAVFSSVSESHPPDDSTSP
jgi:hypothetical protein